MRIHPFMVLAALCVANVGCSDNDSGNTDAGGDGDALGDGNGGDGDLGANGGSGTDGSGGGAGGTGGPADGSFVPSFPGAGTSDAADPLVGGMLCDSVAGGTLQAVGNQHTRCFFGPDDKMNPAATIEQVLECVDGVDVLHLRLTFDPNFVDNTYGEGSVGWNPNRPHTNDKDLVKSDHAELLLVDGDGEVALQFKMDYIEIDPSAPGGYSNQCVTGGDGEVIVGDDSAITACMTSLDRNLNERGYGDYGTDSPATDENYTANPDTPEWDYRMVYEVWIDEDAFGDAGFAGAFINYVHASPAKTPDDTVDVTPGECPPCVPGPDAACADTDIPPGDSDSGGPCGDGNPDTFCSTGEGPGGNDPACIDGNAGTFCAEDAGPCGDGNPDTFCSTGEGPGGNDPACTDGNAGTYCSDGAGPCGDGNPDTFCATGEGPAGDDPGCGDGNPDTFCSDTDGPPTSPPAFCELYPTDPACKPE